LLRDLVFGRQDNEPEEGDISPGPPNGWPKALDSLARPPLSRSPESAERPRPAQLNDLAANCANLAASPQLQGGRADRSAGNWIQLEAEEARGIVCGRALIQSQPAIGTLNLGLAPPLRREHLSSLRRPNQLASWPAFKSGPIMRQPMPNESIMATGLEGPRASGAIWPQRAATNARVSRKLANSSARAGGNSFEVADLGSARRGACLF